MKLKYLAGLILATLIFASCDDTTGNIGSGTLIDTSDSLDIRRDTFEVKTRSIMVDSVLARTNTAYIGKVRDIETLAYLSSDFMTQFYMPEGFVFPSKDSIKIANEGKLEADSCDIHLYYKEFYGDSLAPMKLTAYELSAPIPEKMYYSNFDPEKEGFVNKSTAANKVYTLTDLNVDASVRNGSDYIKSICIPLSKSFGTDLINKFYDHKEYFEDAYTFINKVTPGFYFKTQSGLGAMAHVYLSQLNVYFKHKTTTTKADGTKRDTIIVSSASFPGTEEVLQTTNIINDKAAIKRLAETDTCTYIKSPAGIFTEMTIPVNEILKGHENDTINAAKVSLTRINTKQTGEYALDPPQTLLMIPKAEMYTFFENRKTVDYKTSYLASFDTNTNQYTFKNIGSLVRHMWENKSQNDWDKVVIIPVSTTVNSDGEITDVTHDMSIASTKLVGGSNNPNGAIKITVIYSKFE